MPGAPTSPPESNDSGAIKYFAFYPFIAWLTFIAPWRLGRRFREGGFKSRDAGLAYKDVGRSVAIYRLRRSARRVGTIGGILCVLASLNLTLITRASSTPTIVVLVIVAVIAKLLFGLGPTQLPKPRPPRVTNFFGRAAGASLALLADAIGAIGLLVFLGTSIASAALAQSPNLSHIARENRSMDGLSLWDSSCWHYLTSLTCLVGMTLGQRRSSSACLLSEHTQ